MKSVYRIILLNISSTKVDFIKIQLFLVAFMNELLHKQWRLLKQN